MYRHVNTSKFQTYFKMKLQISKVILDIKFFLLQEQQQQQPERIEELRNE